MGKKGLYLFFVITSFLILIPFVSSATTIIYFDKGLVIVDSPQIYLQQNQPFKINFFVYNITDGVVVDNSTTNCTFYLADKEGQVKYFTNVSYLPDGYWGLNITGGNFSELEEYNYGIKCEGNDLGGTSVGTWVVTQTGQTLETSESLLYIIILITTFILFLGFLYPAIKLPYSNKTNPDGSITRITRAKYLKLLSVWFAYGFFMWFLQTLNGVSKSFISLTYLSNFITNIFTYSQGFSVGITFLILIIMFIEVWKDIFLSATIKKHGKAFTDKRLQ